MRLTHPLSKQSYRYLFKRLWKYKGVMKEPPLLKPRFLSDNAIEIVDPRPMKPVYPPWEPPVKDDPRFMKEPNIKDHPDYHKDCVYRFTKKTRLLEGDKQAMILSKTQPLYQLPQSIRDLIGTVKIPDQDELMQRYIMQANVWNPTKKKLAKRFDPKLPGWKFKPEYGIPPSMIIAMMLQNMLRLCQTVSSRYPELLTSRRLVQNAHISASYYLAGDKQVQITYDPAYLSSSARPLAPFAREETVDQSTAHQLPDLFPISPTIDLKRDHVWRMENSTGWHANFTGVNPHTIFVADDDHWSKSQRNARALMISFANCVAAAKQTYGWDVKTLPSPITTQCITTDGVAFNFVCFQLNTMNFDSNDGVKNLVWFDTNNKMYNKILPKRAMLRNTKYEDYDPHVFKKFLAFFMNGVNI